MRISDWSSDVCSSDLFAGRWTGRATWLVGLRQHCGGLAGRHVQHLQEVGGRHHAEVDVPRAPTRPASLVQSVEPLAAHPLATPCRPVKQASVAAEIGRVSWRERVCSFVCISFVAVYLQKENIRISKNRLLK